MDSEIVKIGNSQGVRIPKPLLKQSGLGRYVSIRAEKGKIIIENDDISGRELAIMSELSLSDWNSKEEDEAWEYLNQAK